MHNSKPSYMLANETITKPEYTSDFLPTLLTVRYTMSETYCQDQYYSFFVSHRLAICMQIVCDRYSTCLNILRLARLWYRLVKVM